MILSYTLTLGGHFRYVSREAETEWLRHRLEARDEVNLAICLSEPARAHRQHLSA